MTRISKEFLAQSPALKAKVDAALEREARRDGKFALSQPSRIEMPPLDPIAPDRPSKVLVRPKVEKKGKSRQSSKKARVGMLTFDSELERRVYEQDVAKHPAVFVHPKISLGHGENETLLVADSIVALEVYPDGTFRAQLTDVKPFTRKWNASRTECKLVPFCQEDANCKRKWFSSQTGIKLVLRDDKGNTT